MPSNTSAFFRPIAMAMKLKNSFVLKGKHLQLILTPVFKSLHMKALLFCAGLGTRLRPLTDNKPKAMVEVAGKPLLQWNIENLKRQSIEEIVVNVHHFPDQIIDFLKKNKNFGITIHISDERDQLLDTGGGLAKASKYFDKEPFLVHNVDILSDINFNKLMEHHFDNEAIATLAVSSRKTSRYLMFDDEHAMLTGWTNINTGDTRISRITTNMITNFAFSGIQIVDPKIFEHFPEEEKFSTIDLYLKVAKTEKIVCYQHDDKNWLDVGKPENIEKAEQLLKKIV